MSVMLRAQVRRQLYAAEGASGERRDDREGVTRLPRESQQPTRSRARGVGLILRLAEPSDGDGARKCCNSRLEIVT